MYTKCVVIGKETRKIWLDTLKNLNFLFEFCFGKYATTKVITGGSDSSFSSEIKICQTTAIHKL